VTEAILSITGLRKLPLVRQSEAAECGLACIAMIAAYHGHDADLSSLRRRFAISLKGTTLAALMDIAAAVGLGARAVRLELADLGKLRAPAILHWDFNHFVVLKRVDGQTIRIHDPAGGVRSLSLQSASAHFTGVALELVPTATFERKRERSPLRIADLVRLSPETLSAFVQAMLLTLLIQLFVLAAPFYVQLVIDEAVLKGDEGLLIALATGFGLLVAFNALLSGLRALVLQYLSSVLSFEMVTRLFSHLLRLPLEWFHKQHVGDVQSRFQSVEPIKTFIANGAIAALLDGVLAVCILALMIYYSGTLAGMVVAAVALYALLRVAMLEFSRSLAGDRLIANAREQTRFLETLRAAQTIKVAGREVQRETLQRNAIAASLDAGIRLGNLEIGYSAVKQAISGAVDVLIVFVAARAIVRGDFTVGMLTAFMAYKLQFTTRVTALVESAITWRLLDVHLERIADIALQAREARIDGGGYDGSVQGAVEARSIGFRYAPGEPVVLAGIDVSVAPGEFVAITGPSGCGKSTLLRILIGLYPPTAGEVLIDGRALASWSLPGLRRQLGVVMQDDQLLQGSVAENIAGFAERIDMARVVEVAQLAQIHEDISHMPMGYQSLVGDMGSILSGGQKQRVLIARALYYEPKILILDEGTSHLDVEAERAVTTALSKLAITRIVVAHRPETVRAADREVRLGAPKPGLTAPSAMLRSSSMERHHA
jgi:ATP-binding cassette, subfamily B, bacterial CvaB/MchF/RaxB